MENNQAPDNVDILDLVTKPDNIHKAFEDPGKFGMEVYNKLTNKQKQYLAFAAGAGLIGYGIFLGKKK